MFGALDVVCIGSATRDVFLYVPQRFFTHNEFVFRPGAKVDVEEMRYSTGGGATNTAVGFSRLGLRAGIACALGNDDNAWHITKELKREKVDTRLAVKLPSLRTAYSVILTGFGRDRVILCYSHATTMLGKAKIDWGRVNAKWFYVSSLHGENEVLRKIAGQAHRIGAKIAFNPGQRELVLGVKGLKELVGKVEVLILNSEEALRLTRSGDIKRNLKALQEIAGVVVVTEGKEGAHAAQDDWSYSMKPFDVKVLDVTGAGDAFSSGFVAALAKGKGVEDALPWGSANAASVITRLGAKNILLTEKEMEKFLAGHKGNEARKEKL